LTAGDSGGPDPAFRAAGAAVASVAAHLAARGWAEASAGNISFSFDRLSDPGPRTEEHALQFPVPDLEGRRVAITASGSRMRQTGQGGGRGLLDAVTGTGGRSLLTLPGVRPTSEASSHMLGHLSAARRGMATSAVVHAHTPALLVLASCRAAPGTIVHDLRKAHPEVDLLLGGAVEWLEPREPGSPALAEATGGAFAGGARCVVWRGHGVLGLGACPDEACDAVEIVETAARLLIERASVFGGHGCCGSPARDRRRT